MTKIRNILIVPDKFKGSLSASGVADALEAAVRRTMVGGAQAEVVKLPMADGGDGSMEVVATALGAGAPRACSADGAQPDGASSIAVAATALGAVTAPPR